jgi:anti-sigma-K factor RskA
MTASDEMTCEQFTEMAPAYALAVLDDTERTACMRHLAQSGPHRGCQQAVGEARQVTARLSAAVPARPPSPGLWRAIEARIADAPTRAVDRRRRPRGLGGWVVPAAIIGFTLVSAPLDTGRGAPVDGQRSTARDGIAAAALGSPLFEPAASDQPGLAADSPDAGPPGDVLLSAESVPSN